jgi:hypothetical protein
MTLVPLEMVAAAVAPVTDQRRTCCECGGRIPADFQARRTTCSTECSKRREKRQRQGFSQSRGLADNLASARSQADCRARRKELEAARAETPAALPSLLLLESVACQLRPSWQAQVAPTEITLSWRPEVRP